METVRGVAARGCRAGRAGSFFSALAGAAALLVITLPVIAVVCGQTPGKLKPALTPEHDVYQDNLRPELLCPPQRLSRVSGHTDDAQASLFQAIAGSLQEQPVVVHDQDPQRRHVTSVPASTMPRIGASRNARCRRLPAG